MNPHPNQIVELNDHIQYAFDDKGAFQNYHHAGSYSHSIYVDDTPCYHHDINLVRDEFERLREIAPLSIPLKLTILVRECRSRTNGFFLNDFDYSQRLSRPLPDGTEYQRVGHIVLGAKRIPIHPAMTRYLVAHEYGHAIQYELEARHGMKTDAMEPGYEQFVRPGATEAYGPGKWHQNIGELIANDFRVLWAQRETDFWPHYGFDRPEHVPACVDFWKHAEHFLKGWADTRSADSSYNKIFKIMD
jgi:hypothetical protein